MTAVEWAEPGREGKMSMSLVQHYAAQYAWRRWAAAYDELGDLAGAEVLDLGCGIGDQARDLAARGASVLGIDANREVIEHAAARRIPRARFACRDIAAPHDGEGPVDSVWTSFTAAYFPRFGVLLDRIEAGLRPGGWTAITELDHPFGHVPLAARWSGLAERYYARSLERGVHRFRSHDHVTEVLAERGWRIEVDRVLEDDEFCFAGPARPDVLEAWRTRLGFMLPQFVARFGAEAAGFDAAFSECLASAEHRSLSRVWFVLARSPA